MTTLEDLQFALSNEGQTLLSELAQAPITPANHLQIATKLRKTVAPPLAQALLELALLRQLGTVKFSKADQMYFTRPALEQATAEPVASYRAERFNRLGLKHIADLGCSIGGDAIALAAHAQVTGVDWDPVRLAMAQENLTVYGRSHNFSPLQADLHSLSPQSFDALFFDPARRDERGRRFFSVH
ncbi:MAG: class I SAM-dependent methyltransferase, partial [Chloroflexota bacterium]